jgi:hypothetical protein
VGQAVLGKGIQFLERWLASYPVARALASHWHESPPMAKDSIP